MAGGEADLKLDLLLRLPAIEGWDEPREGEVGVWLGGDAVASLPVGETWTRHLLRLPRKLLAGEHAPLHRLELRWPALPPADPVAFDAATDQLELGREADLFPVFGEVARLVAGPVG